MARLIKLQLALDVTNLAEALEKLESVYPFVDIIEIGTPLIISEGLSAVGKIKQLYPQKTCLVDVKIMDGGYDISMAAFRCGADIVTVLSLADDQTIKLALKSAQDAGKQIMVDMLNEKNLVSRGMALEALGVPIIGVHTAHDRQDNPANLFRDLEVLRENTNCTLAIAGGIRLAHIQDVIRAGADIIIVGGEIMAAVDPRLNAQAISERLRGIIQ